MTRLMMTRKLLPSFRDVKKSLNESVSEWSLEICRDAWAREKFPSLEKEGWARHQKMAPFL